MKIIKLLLLSFVLLFGLFLTSKAMAATEPFRSRCVGITGTFNSKNWGGGPVMIGCAGDDGGAVSSNSQKCSGEAKTVNPGQSYRLTKCSCFGGSGGCLIVAKKLHLSTTLTKLAVGGKYKIIIDKPLNSFANIANGKCTFSPKNNVCGSNGQRISENFKISCTVPHATPTPTRPPHATPTPTVGICVAPSVVTNVKVTCPSCFGSGQPTPTPTPIAVGEGESCGGSANAFCGADLFCTDTNSDGVGTCQPAPTVTPSPEPTVTPTITPTPTGGAQ